MQAAEREHYRRLCDRIRAHCAEQGWYGPHGELSRDREEEHAFVASSAHGARPPDFSAALIRGCPYWWRYDRELEGYDVLIDRRHDPLRERFAMPTATDAQIAATEAVLETPLPPVLRVLYQELGNGGFGPGGGLYGVQGGWNRDFDGYAAGFTLEQAPLWYGVQGREPTYVALADLDTDRSQPFFIELASPLVPRGVIRLCDVGCATDVSADLTTELVYDIGVGGQRDEQGNWSQVVSRDAALTIEMWLNDWLDKVMAATWPRT